MALNWKPYIYDASAQRRSLTGLLNAGISQSLDPALLCNLAADIARFSSYDTALMLQLGEALTEYAPCSASAWYFKSHSLKLAMQDDRAMQACERALALDPGHLDALAQKGKLLAYSGELELAEDILRRLHERAPGLAVVAFCECLLRRRKLSEAEEVIATFSRRHTPPAGLLALDCVRCLLVNDANGLSTLHQSELISATREGSDRDSLNRALTDCLTTSPLLVEEPASTATVKGRQAFLSDLLPEQLLREVIALIRQQVEQYVSQHSDHPYLANIPNEINLTAWAVVLDQQGFQESHCHPGGKISGVYYVDSAHDENHGGNSGALEFWQPPSDLAGTVDCETRLVQPENGMTLIFPSYYHHRTIPHRGTKKRISIAFDIG